MRRLLKLLYGAALLLCLVIAAAAQSKSSPRVITAEDYFAFEFLSDPHISPDGKLAAYVVTKVDRAQNRRISSVWMVALDGSRFVVVSRIGASDARTENKDRSDVRHYKNTSYKFNDTGWFDDRRTHLWMVDVKTGSAKQITEGNDWNDSDPQWSPDGTRIAFVSNRTGKELEENRNTDVWVMLPDGKSLTKISDHEEADSSPRWSPDGRTIAFTGELRDRDHPK